MSAYLGFFSLLLRTTLSSISLAHVFCSLREDLTVSQASLELYFISRGSSLSLPRPAFITEWVVTYRLLVHFRIYIGIILKRPQSLTYLQTYKNSILPLDKATFYSLLICVLFSFYIPVCNLNGCSYCSYLAGNVSSYF